MRRTTGLVATATVMASALLGGCSSSDSGGGDSPGASSESFEKAVSAFTKQPTSIGEAPALSKPIPAGKKIIQISNGAGYDQVLTKGFKEASAKAGWDFSVLQAKLADPSTTLSALTTAVNAGADAVIISATPMAVWKSQIDEAKAKGTLIILVAGTDDFSTSGVPDGVVQVIPSLGGVDTIADALVTSAVADLGDKSKGAAMVSTTVPQLGAAEVALAKREKELLKERCPKCTLDTTEIPIADVFAGKGPAKVVSYLQSHPDTKYVLMSRGQSAAGLSKAIRASGLPKVKILGSAPSPDELVSLKSGDNLAWVLVPYQVIAWQAMDLANRHVVGDKSITWAPNYWLVTKANADKVSDPANPVYPADYADQFGKLWNVS